MDSINRNQAEQNRLDLSGPQAVQRLREMAKDADSCFFVTDGGLGPNRGVRPMSVREVDDAGHLWFLSANDSHKNAEIAAQSGVKLYFQQGAHSGFLEVDGHAEIVTDRRRIRELWNFMLKTWFTEGEDDPRITAIRVIPRHGYYWDNKHGDAVAGAKVVVGAVLGKTLDDSIEGTLSF
ncbi:pyridoxamine 5'-phosphate oxidase family protein [Massilia oculi]|uniref:Pyridoxamine 5'-phosphate oxidase family protein n=1 Tax=Massilia hydrophila TaxID=3044279 RepID=A0ABS7Y736_9BURK|nr:pyridoxamine 5'-phosphate oxidase family protein [Massilia oculi]MCA1854812.1 pyridoxamine 5'-phosphate oxidase family protein [Massilia oculi]